MKVSLRKRLINVPHLFYLLIWLSSLLPSKYAVEMRAGLKSFVPFGIVLIIIEVLFLLQNGNPKKHQQINDIVGVIYIFFFIWELFVTRLNIVPFVFVPAPENVFYVFVDDYATILAGFVSSMSLLIVGMGLALFFAIILGTLVGWVPRLRNAVYPIVKAVSTVPPLIYTPYVVLIMPTFRSASMFVVFLSIFWGSFMGAINNTRFVEKRIINSARVLNLSTPSILFKIIIPYNMPRIINNLPINLSTALMTLTAAEMIGSNTGMGFYVRYALNFADYTSAIAGIIFIGVVVSGLNALINVLKKKFIKWEY